MIYLFDGRKDVERINTFGIFTLGELLRDTFLFAKRPLADWARTALEVRSYIQSALDPNGPIRLKLSRPAAVRLDECLGEFIQLHLDKKQESLSDQQVDRLNAAYFAFKNAISLELGQAPTFFVTPKGVYDTDTLIGDAAKVYGDLVSVLPEKAVADTNAAGRCLAFTLSTAAGFHVARALEAVAKEYAVVALGCPQGEMDQADGWGDIKNLMGKYKGDKAISRHFDQIRDLHRNPLSHPDITLDQVEAEALWATCTTLAMTMGRAIQAKASGGP